MITPMSTKKNIFSGRGFAVAVANGFGLGNAKFASGTVGSLLGIPLVFAVSLFNESLWTQVAICAVLVVISFFVCDIAERAYGKKDDGRIVADEYLLLPIGFVGRGNFWEALTNGAVSNVLIWLAVGFAIARVVDIVKPTPARQIQALKGGWGVVLDDLVASLYTWILLWGIERWLPPIG